MRNTILPHPVHIPMEAPANEAVYRVSRHGEPQHKASILPYMIGGVPDLTVGEWWATAGLGGRRAKKKAKGPAATDRSA